MATPQSRINLPDMGPNPTGSVKRSRRQSGASGRLQTWLQSIWRRRWLSLAIAWLICMIGWGAIMFWPKHFNASAVIYADLTELAGDKVDAEETDGSSVDILRDILLSDDNLEIVRESVALDSARRAALRDDITLRSTVPPLFVTTYDHHDPNIAFSVLNSLLNGFKARLDAASLDSLVKASSVDEQIADYQRQLDLADDALDDYRKDNADHLDGAEGRNVQLDQLRQEAESLETRVDQATAERDRLAAALAEVPADVAEAAEVAESETVPDFAELEAERADLVIELAKLRKRYADSHPYVSGVLNKAEQLDAQIEAASSAPAPPDIEDDPAKRDALEQEHGELIADVSTLGSRLRAKRREIDLLQALTRTTTSVEAELTKLVEAKEELENSLQSLEQERQELGNVEGDKAKQEAFRLINQPELPADPVGPSRLLALTVVLIGGLGLGAIAALSRNRYKGVFESAWQLKRRFDVGVLGTISETMTPAERKQVGFSKVAFGVAFVTLVGAFGGLVIAELNDMLAPLGDQLRSRFLG